MSKFILKFIKKTVFCVFCLLTLGLFITCDDPNNPFANPFSNNLGPKVVVEPPTIYIKSPSNNSFLATNESGRFIITGYGKAYVKVEKIEWRVDAGDDQRATDWSEAGIGRGPGATQKEWPNWTFNFGPDDFLRGKDGYVTMQFRITDSRTPKESIKYIFKIKNKPSDINMSSPGGKVIIKDEADDKPSKINWGGEISGQIIDIKGIRPGYPQIQIWPATDPRDPDDFQYDPQWGWASLFLVGRDKTGAKLDDINELDFTDNKLGTYADRANMRVVTSSTFSFKLAEFEIVTDPPSSDPDFNPDTAIRRIRYTPDSSTGKHKNLPSGNEYYFRIRTSDVSPDTANDDKPDLASKAITGFFPPVGFRIETSYDAKGNPKDTLFADDYTMYRGTPVKIKIFSNDARPSVEINNDDLKDQPLSLVTKNPSDTALIKTLKDDPNDVLSETRNNPNIYITASTSYKIASLLPGADLFRLRILINQEGLQADQVSLRWTHESTGRSGDLVWDIAGAANTIPDVNGNTVGIIFQFTAKNPTGSPPFDFRSHSEPYMLIVSIPSLDGGDPVEYPYAVYMDGENPDVSIISVKGADREPTSAARPYQNGLVNASAYTVNGNIQVSVDRSDKLNSIKPYRDDIAAFTPGNEAYPPGNVDDRYGFPMVKWVLEEAAPSTTEPASAGTLLANLIKFKDTPNPANLKFFINIKDNAPQSLPPYVTIDEVTANIAASGWVRKPLSSADSDDDADRSHHFKINTRPLTSPNGYWLYIIAQDEVQNLGFIIQKINVNQKTDEPVINTLPLVDKKADDTAIVDENDLNVTVTQSGDALVMTGNWNAERRNNVLENGEGIQLDFNDDDGIDLSAGNCGVEIYLTVLDPLTDVPGDKRVQIPEATIRNILSDNSKSRTGTLTQEILAQALYKNDETTLRDGKYKIEFKVTDDVTKKVKIERNNIGIPDGVTPDIPGDTPAAVSTTVTYFFAVYNKNPEITITSPDDNLMVSSVPVPITGTARSRLGIQNMWITFTPDVINKTAGTSPPILITLTPATGTQPDANGYYNYTWEYAPSNGVGKDPGVIFDQSGLGSDVRTYAVEAYDNLGNKNREERAVQLDQGMPSVDLIDFNHIFPDPDVLQIVYGKVSFTVSASDPDGSLDEVWRDGVKYSGIKWWVVPKTAAPPTLSTGPNWDSNDRNIYRYSDWSVPWFTKPAVNGGAWYGYENFRFNDKNGGRYTGVIDTRYLTDGAEYYLCIVARDNAGNQSVRDDTATSTEVVWYVQFKVDQSLDYPVIDENAISPPQDFPVSLNNNMAISGTVSDDDLFNAGNQSKLNQYVEIRFATGTNPTTGLPVWPTTPPGGWIPIQPIPPKYNFQTGGVNPSGAIAYRFDPTGTSAQAYLSTDGIKYYQIRVTDEPDEATTAEKASGAKNWGKNPDDFMRTNTTVTAKDPNNIDVTYPLYPNYSTDNWVYHDKVSRIFPYPDPDNGYKFIMDNTDPEIFFDAYDPTDGHPNFTAARPTFSTWDLLRNALKGHVIEYKLSTLTMTWKGKTDNDIISLIIPTPDPVPPARADLYPWDLNNSDFMNAKYDDTTTNDAKLKEFFDSMDDGLQTIAFEATDMVGKMSRVAYTFAKDTQGPEIDFVTINRSIKRIFDNPKTVALPGTGNFPANWLTSDFRSGEKWKTDSTWTALFIPTYEVLTSWPSDFARLAPTKVIDALKSENLTPISTVKGDPEEKKTTTPNNYNPPYIEGTFRDDHSPIWSLNSAGTPVDFKFYYRFKKKDVDAFMDPSLGNWREKTIPNTANPLTDQDPRSAKWEIILDSTEGFTGLDGENWLDIRVADFAGNLSEVFNVRFNIDRKAPILGDDPNPKDPNSLDPNKLLTDADEFIIAEIPAIDNNPTPGSNGWKNKTDKEKQLPEMERVFSVSGEGTPGDSVAFILQGTVSDANLSNIDIIIGQEGYNYTVSASLLIDSNNAKAPWPGIGGNDGLTATQPDDKINITTTDTGIKRLSIVKLDMPDGSTPRWTWQLKILQKDVAQLREETKNASGITDDSARRYVQVSATDKARQRAGPVKWYFYLDTKKPNIEYTLQKGGEGDCSSFEDENIALSGFVSDDTKIKDVQYMIGRWEYNPVSGAAGWRWYNSATDSWTLPAPPTPHSEWPSAFDTLDKAGNDAKRPNPSTAMNWTITQLTLDAANKKTPKPFPANLFSLEGRYRIDLYVTDFSLGSGNPHDTTNIVDEDFGDKGNYKTPWPENPTLAGQPNNLPHGYDPDTGVGNASGRMFYIDKKDPNLLWGWYNWNETTKTWERDPADTDDTQNRTYFRNVNGAIPFKFTVGDGNTIQYWHVEVRDDKNSLLLYKTIDPTSDMEWEAGSDLHTTSADKPIADPGIDPKETKDQHVTVFPYMTTTGDDSGQALDLAAGTTPTYTITITVRDGSERENRISKQFTLDNTPPRFIQEKFQPRSFKWKTGGTEPADSETVNSPGYTPVPSVRTYSFDAITGKLEIRGNAEDNSNQIKKISYYVVPGTTAAAAYPDPTSAAIPWLSSADKNSIIYADIADSKDPSKKAVLMQIDEGTFAWKIMIPQTSLFFTDIEGKKYLQTPTNGTTGGVTMSGGTTATAGDYNDLDPLYTGTVWGGAKPRKVPFIEFPDLNNPSGNKLTTIYGGEDVGLITIYVRAEDAAGNVAYDVVKYWIWPEGDRPIITSINTPDSSKIEAERLLNGTIRLGGMAKDNERVKNVWFRVLGPDGITPYTDLDIPDWERDEVQGWIDTGKRQKPAVNDDHSTYGRQYLGARRKDDPGPPATAPNSIGGGWYRANGGDTKEVSWFAYINTKGELDPAPGETKKEFTVEVRAQDVTYDVLNDVWMNYSETSGGYRGLASAMTKVSKVTAWVVAGAPIFENVYIAPSDSKDADGSAGPPVKPALWDTLENLNIRNRSAYKVTVKHNSGLSAVRWSPTEWNESLNGGDGGFQANPGADPYNLLDLLARPEYSSAEPAYVYWDGVSKSYKFGTRTAVFNLMMPLTATGDAVPRMAATIVPSGKLFTGSVTLTPGKSYLIVKWDDRLATSNVYKVPTFAEDPNYYQPPPNQSKYKDLKNSVFVPTTLSGNIGDAIIIEAVTDTIDPGPPAKTMDYFKLDVIVDVRADLLLKDMPDSYGTKSGQTRDSVRYPVYLSASEVSKSTPLSSKFDSLLPIDNLPPDGMYTLNRKVLGSAATIGGEASDDGPVNGVARVVLWFQRKGGDYISWRQTDVPAFMPPYSSTANNPKWWDDINKENVIPAGVTRPNIPNLPTKPGSPEAANPANGTGGNYAIVIDRNSPSTGQNAWGHRLPMGFADGGSGKYWYVEIDSTKIESGPVDLHFVVIDKAGNAHYYKERLVIMNGVAVIDRIKLATDIRDNSAFSFQMTNPSANNRTGNGGRKTGADLADYPFLKVIRDGVPLGGDSDDIRNDVKKGISDWVLSSALGVNRIVDFNVRNNLFALRVETTNVPSNNKPRNFRLEYVSSARLLSDTSAEGQRLTDIKAGRVYIINDPGQGATAAKWGAVGAEGDGPWPRGYAFLAAIDGMEDNVAKITGSGSVWELNYGYPAIGERVTGATGVPTKLPLDDVKYTPTETVNARGAEFVYGTNAFGAGGIVDFTNTSDSFPPTATADPAASAELLGNSMFILRVFDGPEDDMFGTFTIIRVRVNNDDKTKPFAQLYDINPKTEGQERSNIAPTFAGRNNEQTRSVSPMFIGEGTNSNRTKGGLWNTSASVTSVEKPGHIEPRRMTTGYGTGTTTNLYTALQPGESAPRNHSLSSAQMGGAAIREDATIQKPWANPEGFFAETTNNGIRGGDTVSGRVVLRGYAEDDQRIAQVVLNIGGTPVTILDFQAHSGTVAEPGYGTAGNNDSSKAAYNGTNGNADSNLAAYGPPLTGLLRVGTNSATNPTTDRVYFTDSIDAYRHRVEWAYIWDTETLPATVVGDNVTVRVISYIRNGASGTTPKTAPTSDEINAPGTAHTNTSDATRPNTSPYNKEFPVGLNKYNRINFNLRPYITGFLRNKTVFSHDTRSRQGRYMFYRGETAVVKGFNLGTGTTATISIPGAANLATADVDNPGDFGIETNTNILPLAKRNQQYRRFRVGTSETSGATTGDGVVTYSYNSRTAVNTSTAAGERGRGAGTPVRPAYIQPWNIEYSPGINGSQLWDDFTQVHIWQSNDTATGNDSGRFPKGNNLEVFDPAMSIDPATGMLWSSHNEGGGGGGGTQFNTGSTKVGNINGNGSYVSAAFIDPIINSDIYVSPRASGYNNLNYTIWTTYSIIGRSGTTGSWRDYGGVYASGPEGANAELSQGQGVAGNNNNGFGSNQYNARSQYLIESTGYNAGTNTEGNVDWPPGNSTNPPQRNQFKNPHIVTYDNNNIEHIHVSYYDTKDGSIKYRYNRRGSPGTMAGNMNNNVNNALNNNNMPYAWTNLDGGLDLDDQNAFNSDSNGNWASGGGGGWYRAPFSGFTAAIDRNGRIVNYNTASRRPAETAGGGTPANKDAWIDAGEYNSIAVTSQGYPVVAYFDKTNQKLKLAISNNTVPIAAANWKIIENVIPATIGGAVNPVVYGTGLYVSMKIDTRATLPGTQTPNPDLNRIHIAAMNAVNKNLVYISGFFNYANGTFGGASNGTGAPIVQVVDNVGSVGRWCNLSLDIDGNPWIGYQDESYQGSRDGVKLAYRNVNTYYKGRNTGTEAAPAGYFPKDDKDMYGVEINGWEAMHVPTAFRVDNARVGMECFPTRNVNTNNTKFWLGAVGFLGEVYFRVAYYVR